MMVGSLPGVEPSLPRTERVEFVSEDVAVVVNDPDSERVGRPLDP